MFAKGDVNGDDAHDFYKWMKFNAGGWTSKTCELSDIGWNFGKFLVDKDGLVVNYYGPHSWHSTIEKDIAKLVKTETILQ